MNFNRAHFLFITFADPLFLSFILSVVQIVAERLGFASVSSWEPVGNTEPQPMNRKDNVEKRDPIKMKVVQTKPNNSIPSVCLCWLISSHFSVLSHLRS